MKRRTFLKTLTGLSVAGALPMTLTPAALGATAERFLITVNATGGWDPTALIDPKGNAPRADGLGAVNNYSAAAIKSIGKLSYAPYPDMVEQPPADSAGHCAVFFNKHAEKIRVINGIDTQTNGHDSGRRFIWSGKLQEGYPTVAALAAAPYAEQPMAFISNGGYDFTASLVAPVRTASPSTFDQLAYPNAMFPSEPELLSHGLVGAASYDLVQQARTQRLIRQRALETLPKRQRQMDQLQTVKSSDIGLKNLLEALPAEVSAGFAGQAELAVAAFTSGLAVAANLSAGGFDTHGNHDQDHTQSLTTLLAGIDHLWSQIEAHGLEEKVTIIVGSDFGRTPFYNSGAGKDHWNITSIMAMGAGITGNRVIGATDDNFNALALNAESLQPDDNGVIITPQHIHRSLRDFMGIQSDLDNLYPIEVEKLDLFS